MASGDIKSAVDDCVIITVTLGATTKVGDICCVKADGKWDPVTTDDQGKFGVALDAGVDTGTARMLIWGQVEVKATAATIPKGELIKAGTTGFAVKQGAIAETNIYGLVVGTAMTAFASSGQGTVFVGLTYG